MGKGTWTLRMSKSPLASSLRGSILGRAQALGGTGLAPGVEREFASWLWRWELRCRGCAVG